MPDIIQTIKGLPNFLPLAPATKIEISDAEIQLCLQFADDYKKYLIEFGSIIADGIELTGMAKSEHRNVVSVTKQEWQLNAKVPHTMYVVENVAIDGIIVWQNTKGEIFQTTPGKKPIKIADSLNEYLKKENS